MKFFQTVTMAVFFCAGSTDSLSGKISRNFCCRFFKIFSAPFFPERILRRQEKSGLPFSTSLPRNIR